ncbi:MAG: sigma-70 family RNA polymerase sigma factor [Chlorobi bacterium]|nr:sigma-70 family RNA polymerase sigma factor [Chlorobiota bacterium]
MTGESKIHDIHQDLIEGCRNNDRKAQVRIYELYYKAMYNTSYRILNNAAEAEDTMQEAFLDAFRKIDSYKGSGSFGSWLKKIVVNKSLDKLRIRKETESLEEQEMEIEDAAETDDSYAGNVFNRLEDVARAMEMIPDQYRIILSLYLLEGYDHEEIAEILNISYNNARTRYARAKQRLLNEIGKQREKLINPINN